MKVCPILIALLYRDSGKADGYDAVRISEEKAKKMDEWYKKWLKARAAGKYKYLKPEWKWIGDAEEAQKVNLTLSLRRDKSLSKLIKSLGYTHQRGHWIFYWSSWISSSPQTGYCLSQICTCNRPSRTLLVVAGAKAH